MPFDVRKPIAWVGADKGDRLLIRDRTQAGLHRVVVARKNEPPDVEEWLRNAEIEAKGAEVCAWLVEKEDFVFLWIVWKEAKGK